jgi:hypothetical protein
VCNCSDVDDGVEGKRDGGLGVGEGGAGKVGRGVKRRGRGLGILKGRRREKVASSGGEGGEGRRERTILEWISGEEQRMLKEKEKLMEKRDGNDREGDEGEWVTMKVALDGSG